MVVLRILRCLAEGSHDMGRRGEVRVPYAEVNDIDAFSLLLSFHLVDPCKKVRREIVHA